MIDEITIIGKLNCTRVDKKNLNQRMDLETHSRENDWTVDL